jgi:hypothetical protein
MECTVLYHCAHCGASSSARVTGLPDRAALVSARAASTLEAIAETKRKLGVAADPAPVEAMEDRIRRSLAEGELRYATCPRCRQRNPEGARALAQERMKTRAIGMLVSLLVAIGTWFWPWLAWLGVILFTVEVALVLFVTLRAPRSERRWFGIARSTVMLAIATTIALKWPRAGVILPLLLVASFARTKESEQRWLAAAEKIDFDLPYR